MQCAQGDLYLWLIGRSRRFSINFSPVLFYLSALGFPCQPPLLRALCGLRLLSLPGNDRGSINNLLQSANRILFILFLRSETVCFYNNDALRRDARVRESCKFFLDKKRERRGMNVEAEMNSRGDFVDVLAAISR